MRKFNKDLIHGIKNRSIVSKIPSIAKTRDNWAVYKSSKIIGKAIPEQPNVGSTMSKTDNFLSNLTILIQKMDEDGRGWIQFLI